MPLPASQPVTEILRGWTVARGIPAEVIDGIHSGKYELCGGVIRIAAGNGTAGRIIRHRKYPHVSQLRTAARKLPGSSRRSFKVLSAGFSTSSEARLP